MNAIEQPLPLTFASIFQHFHSRTALTSSRLSALAIPFAFIFQPTQTPAASTAHSLQSQAERDVQALDDPRQ